MNTQIKEPPPTNAVESTPWVINIIVGEKRMNDFLHAADIFEPFKQYGEVLSMEFELTKSKPNLAFLIRFKEQLEKHGDVVTALWFARTPEIHYVDWSVKVTSDGKKWAVLKDYLKQFGIIENNEPTA